MRAPCKKFSNKIFYTILYKGGLRYTEIIKKIVFEVYRNCNIHDNRIFEMYQPPPAFNIFKSICATPNFK